MGRPLRAVILTATALSLSPSARAEFSPPRPSPKGVVSQTIGTTDVTLTYSRPGVKGRPIWGTLVPYDKVWRTGANEPTSIVFADDVTVNGQKLAKGTYSLHTIPGKDEWTVIFNKFFPKGGYEYKAEDDVLKLKVKPEAGENVEWMTFSFPALTPTSAQLVLAWEKLRLPLTIGVDVNAKVMASAREAMAGLKADDWQTPMRAGSYAAQTPASSEEGLKWLDRSVSMNANFSNLAAKARALAANGKTADAVATGEKALAAARAAEKKPDAEAVANFEKELAGWKAKK
ncbi:MAG: DUF2911 domain-containing protein [Thermoanaerobaculia bacterium]